MTRFRLATADTFRSLQHRNYRLYFVGQAVSFTGTWIQLVAQALLVLRITDNSGTALGLLTGIQFAPTLVLGAWSGAVIDRHDKRLLMQLTTTVMLAAASVLAVLVLTDTVTLAWVYALAAVLGLANTFDNPARRSLVNELVPEDHVSNAVSLNSTIVTTARLLGPAIAGALVATVGIGWCFVINAASFLGPLAAVRRMDTTTMRVHTPVPREKGQVRAGLRYAWSVDEVRVPLLMMALVGTLSFNSLVTLPLLAKDELGGGDATYSWLASTGSAGMLIGSLWLARRQHIDTRLLALSTLGLGVTNFALAASPTIPVALLSSFLVGLTGVGVLSGGNTVLQLAATPEMRGRVLALFTLVFLGSTPIGGPIMGALADGPGIRVGIAVGGAAALLAGLAALAWLRLAADRRAPVASSVALTADDAAVVA